MSFWFYITIITAFSLIYYGYEKKKKYELKAKEIELEQQKLELEKIKIENGKVNEKETQ
ncbi:hypothetical protein SAMN04488072_102317 [Lentibacillus halodurans]|uniref:Uncharacterized protein n=1 Tax=Lentibacillus halodurans TaxID=237679 RepID=A0A1I0W9F3_9BACI|nr:hypothetical protein [Lentibacillus halodurans]SFA85184.1 hypothetical protein SAMN04488072_102317 [Lentibacillus halodurans]